MLVLTNEVAFLPLRRNAFRKWLSFNHAPRFVLCDDAVALAKSIAMEGWQERARERGITEPVDLSGGCKFSSLFVKMLFGGAINGNYDHQFNVIDGVVFDLNAESADVLSLAKEGKAHWHNPRFMGSRDHCLSLESCFSRVESWVSRFTACVKK